MSLVDLVHQSITPAEIQNISQQLGTDPATAQNAIHAAVPMMLGGMANTAAQPGGESAIQAAIGGMLGGGGGGAGGMLGSILGQHHSTVQDGVQRASGLDAGKAAKLLMLLAPFIMRALAQHQASPAAAQGGGLAGALQQAASNAQGSSASPQVGGVLGKILGGMGG